MIVKDRIYGKFQISSPVIIALLKSPSVQRLKKIAQYGIPDEYYHLKGYSRFEHSIGVMLLLNHLGASEKEQIAGLLHDISHTAFSHVIDWVIDQGHKETFQDDNHQRYFRQSEIPQILTKYEIPVEDVLDYHKYGLLERNIPQLCADRIDYAIREFPHKIASICFKNFTLWKNKIVMKNKESAYLFGHYYLKRQRNHWAGFEAASRYHIFSRALQLALKKKIITFNDFWKYDELIIKKLESSTDQKITTILTLLRNKNLRHRAKKKEKIFKKVRYVDPEILIRDKTIKLSQISSKYLKELSQTKKYGQNGILQLSLD